MGKKDKGSRKSNGDAGFDKKRKRGPTVIPLPEDRPGDSDSDFALSDEDADFLEEHGEALDFLANLPKAAMDKEVSQARGKEKKPRLDGHKNAEDRPTAKERSAPLPDPQKKKKKGGRSAVDSDDDEEGEDWERGPRRATSTRTQAVPSAGPLPIKTFDGEIVADPERVLGSLKGAKAMAIKDIGIAGVSVHDDLEDALQAEKEAQERKAAEAAAQAARKEAAEKKAAAEKARKEREAAGVLGKLAEYDSIEQRRQEAKQAMAVAAQALLGDPEAQLSKQMRVLLSLLRDEDAQVARLAMLSLLAVMKDLIPGYRIRPPSEKEQEGVAISKEVRKLWDFEAGLLKSYQTYLKALLAALNASRGGNAPAAHGRVAARCMSGLLVGAPHFNFASDLLQAVVPNMANKDEQTRKYCCDAVAALLKTGLSSAEAGQTAVEAVQLVADLIKRRKCVAPPEVVESLLELDFPEILNAEDFVAARLARKKKKKKKKDEVDKGFKEAQAVVDRDTRRHQQSTTLEALFEVYFRVIKSATASGLVTNNSGNAATAMDVAEPPLPASRFAKRFPLLAPTMRGLSKFAHLISVDYFQDLMAAVEELLGSPALPPAQRLRCLLTASEILRGQGEALTIDRRTFYNHLYSALNQVALTPLTEEDFIAAGLGDSAAAAENAEDPPLSAAAAAAALAQHTAFVADTSQVPTLLAKLLESMLLESKLLDVARQAAFAKRAACTAAAAGDTGTSMGLVCVLQRMLRRQPKLRGMLDNEAGGPSGFKSYRFDLEDPAESGALSVPLWELSALTAHYHPHVAQAAKDIANMNVAAAHAAAARTGSAGGSSAAGSAVLPLGTSPMELAAQYSTAKGGFRPAPKAPVAAGSKQAQQTQQSKAARVRAAAMKRAADDPSALAELLAKLEEAAGIDMEDVLPESEAEEVSEVQEALAKHYSLNRKFQKNAELRQEHALLATKLHMFHEHLQKKQKIEGQKRKSGKKSGAEDGKKRQKR